MINHLKFKLYYSIRNWKSGPALRLRFEWGKFYIAFILNPKRTKKIYNRINEAISKYNVRTK